MNNKDFLTEMEQKVLNEMWINNGWVTDKHPRFDLEMLQELENEELVRDVYLDEKTEDGVTRTFMLTDKGEELCNILF